jgi:DNA-binding transcriptional regulator GbsR (MarR family)
MDSLTEQQMAYIEEMGASVEQVGLARSTGRVVGTLLIADGPLTQEDLMRLLGVSRTSTSVALHWLSQLGFIAQACVPGGRKRCYQMRPDIGDWMIRTSFRQMDEDLRLLIMAESVAEPGARGRIHEMREFYEYLHERMDAALTEWLETKGPARSTVPMASARMGPLRQPRAAAR